MGLVKTCGNTQSCACARCVSRAAGHAPFDRRRSCGRERQVFPGRTLAPTAPPPIWSGRGASRRCRRGPHLSWTLYANYAVSDDSVVGGAAVSNFVPLSPLAFRPFLPILPSVPQPLPSSRGVAAATAAGFGAQEAKAKRGRHPLLDAGAGTAACRPPNLRSCSLLLFVDGDWRG